MSHSMETVKQLFIFPIPLSSLPLKDNKTDIPLLPIQHLYLLHYIENVTRHWEIVAYYLGERIEHEHVSFSFLEIIANES